MGLDNLHPGARANTGQPIRATFSRKYALRPNEADVVLGHLGECLRCSLIDTQMFLEVTRL
jgi:hypothetical protein